MKYDQVVKLGNFPNFRCTRTRCVEFAEKIWMIFFENRYFIRRPSINVQLLFPFLLQLVPDRVFLRCRLVDQFLLLIVDGADPDPQCFQGRIRFRIIACKM